LRRADHSSKESTVCVKESFEPEEETRAQQKAVEPLMKHKLLNINYSRKLVYTSYETRVNKFIEYKLLNISNYAQVGAGIAQSV
jgi:hypothetical protein